MNEAVISFDISDLVTDLESISKLSTEEITENVLQSLGKDITQKAKVLAPYKTGNLRSSISYVVSGSQLTIDAAAPYATYIEFGTGSQGEFPGSPYVIRAKPGRTLSFVVNGKRVFYKKVTHPGIKAKPYLRPAAIEVMGPLLDKLAKRGQALIVKGPRSVL